MTTQSANALCVSASMDYHLSITCLSLVCIRLCVQCKSSTNNFHLWSRLEGWTGLKPTFDYSNTGVINTVWRWDLNRCHLNSYWKSLLTKIWVLVYSCYIYKTRWMTMRTGLSKKHNHVRIISDVTVVSDIIGVMQSSNSASTEQRSAIRRWLELTPLPFCRSSLWQLADHPNRWPNRTPRSHQSLHCAPESHRLSSNRTQIWPLTELAPNWWQVWSLMASRSPTKPSRKRFKGPDRWVPRDCPMQVWPTDFLICSWPRRSPNKRRLALTLRPNPAVNGPTMRVTVKTSEYHLCTTLIDF